MSRYRCPNDGMPLPKVAEVLSEAEPVQFFWCADCGELFGSVGNPGRPAGAFKPDGTAWQIFRSAGAASDVRLAVAAVTHVEWEPPAHVWP
jgi:hypothetical protein